ncbi:MAG: guanine permease [candidate division Zixibacteria bacterium SM23_81]|nr:MAG: guanine permease [candidate division Zixibacteria bacterium SM23_81]
MSAKLFRLEEHGTTVKNEILGGVTTFITMAYIIIVNPAILEAAGIPRGPSMVATILSAVFGTLIMGFYANRPFAIAPYMGENAFVAFTVVRVLGYSWQTAIGAIFVGGVLFTVLTVFRLRSWLANAIPQGLKFSFAAGIGLFLTFIGLNMTKLVVLGSPGAPVKIGQVTSVPVLLAVFCFLLMGVLLVWKVKGALLISIVVTTFGAFILGAAKTPDKLVSMPPSLGPIFLKLDILGALTWGFFAVILTVFVMDFVDTMGTLIGVSARAGFLDEDGNLPQVDKPMLADALATVVGALLGTTTTGTYIESAAGIEEGGRTGLTAVVTAVLFLLALFFAPFFTAVPALAYGPALIVVGLLMLSPIACIKFEDYTELIPAFMTVVLMSFTFNIGVGMTAGFVLYPFFKLISGRAREVHPGMWVLGILSLLFYIFYPYT